MGLFYKKKKIPTVTGQGDLTNIAVVFVHGLGGGRETWRTMTELLCDEWKHENDFKLHFLHYYFEGFIFKYLGWTNFMRFVIRILSGKSLESLALGLNSYIDVNCRNFDYILLVSHSMGGLISKKYIVDALAKSHQTKVKRLITYATPHRGSLWAELGIKRQIRQMNPYSSEFLNRLNDDWANFRAFEKVKPIYIVGEADWIVGSDSASGTDPKSSIVWASGQDHSSIIKPKTNDHVGFKTLYNTLEDLLIEYEDDSEDEYEDDFDMGLEDLPFENDFDEDQI